MYICMYICICICTYKCSKSGPPLRPAAPLGGSGAATPFECEGQGLSCVAWETGWNRWISPFLWKMFASLYWTCSETECHWTCLHHLSSFWLRPRSKVTGIMPQASAWWYQQVAPAQVAIVCTRHQGTWWDSMNFPPAIKRGNRKSTRNGGFNRKTTYRYL